ncbi:MAG: 50S ribosomal protein L19 [Patescibacteria group bacterium]
MKDMASIEHLKSGSTVRVFERVKEGDKERISRFEGIVLARKHGNEPGASFTVRATIAGVGVEKVYQLHSPLIDKIEVLEFPRKVSRSKLYYIRDLSRKALRRKVKSKGTSTVGAPAKKVKVVEEQG